MLPFSLFSHLTECPNLRNEISASDLIRHYIWPWHHCCRHTNLLVPTLFHLYWFQSISRRSWIVTCEWCWLYVYVNKDSPQKAPKMIIRYNIISIKDDHHLFKHPSLSTKQILQTSLHIVTAGLIFLPTCTLLPRKTSSKRPVSAASDIPHDCVEILGAMLL